MSSSRFLHNVDRPLPSQKPGPPVRSNELRWDLGLPTANTTVAILKPNSLDILPAGGVGELCVAGPQLALGYLGLCEETKAKFVDHPELGRLLRTGDLGSVDSGRLKFAGRLDHQVQVNGNRVELQGVESKVLAVRGEDHVHVLPALQVVGGEGEGDREDGLTEKDDQAFRGACAMLISSSESGGAAAAYLAVCVEPHVFPPIEKHHLFPPAAWLRQFQAALRGMGAEPAAVPGQVLLVKSLPKLSASRKLDRPAAKALFLSALKTRSPSATAGTAEEEPDNVLAHVLETARAVFGVSVLPTESFVADHAVGSLHMTQFVTALAHLLRVPVQIRWLYLEKGSTPAKLAALLSPAVQKRHQEEKEAAISASLVDVDVNNGTALSPRSLSDPDLAIAEPDPEDEPEEYSGPLIFSATGFTVLQISFVFSPFPAAADVFTQ